MSQFPKVSITGSNRLILLSSLIAELEKMFSEPKDDFGKMPDDYIIEALKEFRLSAFASQKDAEDYIFISNEFWHDNYAALSIMAMKGDLSNAHDESMIPHELIGKVIRIHAQDMPGFLTRMAEHLEIPVRKTTPRYGGILVDRAYMIIAGQGGLSEIFTKAHVVRLLKSEPFLTGGRPASSTYDLAVDRALNKWRSKSK